MMIHFIHGNSKYVGSVELLQGKIPYNGIFSRRQILAVLSKKHADYFSQILIFAVGNVREK